VILAALADQRHGALNYALAGLAAAIALAVGAETTPLICVVCVIIALRWMWDGDAFSNAARAFGLSFGVLTAAAFVATVPPKFYSTVTCDSLSFGFMSVSAFGGIALFALASLFSKASMRVRLMALAGLGVASAALVLAVMPQCLQNPLNSLDPLLKTVWLSGVQEAQPIFRQIQRAPESVGGFYLPGLLGIIVVLMRLRSRDRVEVHAAFLVLLTAAWLISLMQVRASMFAQLISILPLSVLVAELHAFSRQHKEKALAGLPFALMLLASLPAFWFAAGVTVAEQLADGKVDETANVMTRLAACSSRQNLTALDALPKGMIAAPSNMGSPILRYTRHSVLAAPYHRNQAGMLAVLRAGLAPPRKAEAILGDVGASYFVYCPGDLEVKELAGMAPDGFDAAIDADHIPPFLNEVPLAGTKGIRVFRFVR
jgi:hypothetical protein